jgi:hypothetical protein
LGAGHWAEVLTPGKKSPEGKKRERGKFLICDFSFSPLSLGGSINSRKKIARRKKERKRKISHFITIY